ncbi:hypothetical protein AB0J35_61605 [Nonomuraea angiospora]|uniref:hypothetical protein n=1 Tax=Nonomuraea angiospora TaxID=46172 RepID=UPI003418BC10
MIGLISVGATQPRRRCGRIATSYAAVVVGAGSGVSSLRSNSARPWGTKVTTSAVNVQCCRDLDAAYLSDDAARGRPDEDSDVILNAYGGSLRAYRHLVPRAGRMVTMSPGRDDIRAADGARRVRLMMAAPTALAEFVDQGKCARSRWIDSLESLAEAHRAVETGPAAERR